MQQEISRSLKNSLAQIQGPLPELMDLNMRTFRNLSFIKPEEWSNLRNPQDMFEKGLKVFVNNGHKMLEYFQQATEIFERSLFLASNQTMKSFRQEMSQSKPTKSTKKSSLNLKGKKNGLTKKSH